MTELTTEQKYHAAKAMLEGCLDGLRLDGHGVKYINYRIVSGYLVQLEWLWDCYTLSVERGHTGQWSAGWSTGVFQNKISAIHDRLLGGEYRPLSLGTMDPLTAHEILRDAINQRQRELASELLNWHDDPLLNMMQQVYYTMDEVNRNRGPNALVFKLNALGEQMLKDGPQKFQPKDDS